MAWPLQQRIRAIEISLGIDIPADHTTPEAKLHFSPENIESRIDQAAEVVRLGTSKKNLAIAHSSVLRLPSSMLLRRGYAPSKGALFFFFSLAVLASHISNL